MLNLESTIDFKINLKSTKINLYIQIKNIVGEYMDFYFYVDGLSGASARRSLEKARRL